MMTRLRWILGYMRLEIWRKITSLQTDVVAQRYTLVAVHAAIGLVSSSTETQSRTVMCQLTQSDLQTVCKTVVWVAR